MFEEGPLGLGVAGAVLSLLISTEDTEALLLWSFEEGLMTVFVSDSTSLSGANRERLGEGGGKLEEQLARSKMIARG
jgi:hypothetical protein